MEIALSSKKYFILMRQEVLNTKMFLYVVFNTVNDRTWN